jgi:hypothetical protein
VKPDRRLGAAVKFRLKTSDHSTITLGKKQIKKNQRSAYIQQEIVN